MRQVIDDLLLAMAVSILFVAAIALGVLCWFGDAYAAFRMWA